MKTTHLKAFFTVGILLIAHQLFAVTKTALLPGAWNNALTWLPLGVPAADDDVVIGNAGNVTVTGSFTCKSLRIGGLLANLTINAGSSLTVDQDVLMQVNAITEGNTFNVLGSLVVKGNLRLEYLVNAATGGSNTLNVGDATNLGSIRIVGDLRLFSSTVASTTKRNTFNFQHGNLFLEKNAVISSNVPTSQVSILNVNDNTTFDNKPKNIFLNGALIGFTVNNYAFLDGNQNAPYAVMYQGTAPQVLAINGLVYQNVIISNSAGVTLEASLPTSALIGNLRVESNGKLDMANFNLNGANRRAGQIFVDNNGVLSLSTATNFPAHLVSGAYAATMAPSAIVEYRLTANSSVMTAAFNYPIVKLYGNVTKTVGTINNTTIKVNEIQLLEGTMQFSPGVPLVMNNALSKRVIISAGTFVEVQQDFSALDANFSIHPTSTFSYTENGSDQRVYGLKNTSGQFEPYGNLTFLRRDGLGNYKRDIAANDIVKILGKLSLASNGRLNVNQNAILEFSSNATYTGYLAAVPTSFQFNYLGNPVGKAVVRKYIALPAANYRDFTSPIKGVTLRSFQNAGLRMTGFPGSQFPTFSFKNAYKYNEAVAGHFNQGFYPATSIDNPIVTMEGTKLTSAGWRVYAGSNAGVQFTLSDTGLFNIGDIVYKLGFTAGGTDRLNDDGWNFIGNPYPCPISWTKIANDPSNALLFTNKSLRPAVYMWRPADTGVPNDPEDSYSFFNSFTGVSSHAFETNIIPANQGFWLKAYSATSNNTSFDLTIKESHKVDQQASAFYKSQGVDYNKLKLSLKLTQGNRTDQIWAHPFPEANEGHDVLFDIARFGEITDGPNLNFTLNAESMNCWVNAFSDKQAETQLPLEVFTPKAGTATFAISNVAQLLETFGCISITDVFTGLTFPVVADTAIEFESTPAFRGVRFILNIKRSLVSAVETSDAICFDDNNGKLEIDLTGLANEVDFTLLRNGVVFDSIVGPAVPVSLNLGRGNYTLVNNRGLISCLSNSFNFTIESYPEVISSFSAPAEWRQNQFIPIENTSIGASSQLWRFSDGFVTAAKNPLYFFDTPGLYTISLESKNEFECSGGEVTREIQILNTTGIGNQAAPENTSVNSASDGIQVFIGGADQTWNTTVTDAAGRMLWSGKLSSGVHNTLPVYPNQQILILSAKGSEKSWAIRLMH